MFQAQLLDLLRTFKVESPADFDRLPPVEKTYFIKRLYTAFQRNHDEALEDLASIGGVKFHFLTTGDLTQKHPNVPTPAFLKKLCFYSNRTLVTFPFREVRRAGKSRAASGLPKEAWVPAMLRDNRPLVFGAVVSARTPVGGTFGVIGQKAYHLDRAAFADFLQVVTHLQPALRAGITYVLPALPDQKREFRNASLQLTGANFEMSELRRQFLEEELADPERYRFRGDLLNLYLPYFTHIPLERILEIREKQQDHYNEFQRYLETLLYGLSGKEAEKKLMSFLMEVDKGVRDLNRKFESIRAEYRRKDVYTAIGVLCTGLAMFAGMEYAKEVGQMISAGLGSCTALQFVNSRHEKTKSFTGLRDDRFYLPWLLQQAA